jgi:SAM-dependent methyltransferase
VSIWDAYGNWDEIAGAGEVHDVKKKITGNMAAWRPNFCPPALSYAFEYAVDEYANDFNPMATALDFGCGLGRNSPLLKRHFPDLIGVDLPEMIARLQTEPSFRRYRKVFPSLATAAESENFCLIYESVVLQHIIDGDFIAKMLAPLASLKPLRTFVSLTNVARDDAPHVAVLKQMGWFIWHTEVETLSFEGLAHRLTIFRRAAL